MMGKMYGQINNFHLYPCIITMNSVEFALRSGEIVEIKSHELPQSAEEICSALKIEGVNLEVYGSIANLYKSNGNIKECMSVLQMALEDSESRNDTTSSSNFLILKSAILMSSALYDISEESLDQTTLCLNTIERLNYSEISSREALLLKALIYYHRGLLDLCEAQLRTLCGPEVYDEGKYLYFFLSGIIKLKSTEYQEALKNFIESFKLHPWGPTMVLIGASWGGLGYLEKEMECLRIALEIAQNPSLKSNIVSKMIRLCCKIPSKKYIQEGMSIFMQLLESVLNQEKPDYNGLALLIEHFFYKKQFNIVRSLVSRILKDESILNSLLLSYIYFIQAKMSHIESNFEDALIKYMTSLRHKSDFWPSVLGISKIYVQRKDINSAINFLEKLPLNVVDPSTQHLLFMVYMHKYLESKNAKYLKLARNLALSTSNSMYSTVYQQLACPNIDFRDKHDEDAYYSVNHASLSYIFDSVTATHQSNVISPEFDEVLKFNKISMEPKGNFDDLSFPGNVDYMLLTGYWHLNNGFVAKAVDIAKELVGSQEDDAHGWFLLADCQFVQKAYVPCRKTLERVLQKIDRHSEVALVKLGDLYISIARSSKKSGDAKNVQSYYKRAMEFFAKALTLHPSNVYASLGVAIVLADSGDYVSSKEIYDGIRGAEHLLPELEIEACLGAAFCLFSISPNNDSGIFSCFSQANRRMESTLKLNENIRQKVISMHAKAYFICGLALSQVSYLQKSIELLERIDKKHLERPIVEMNQSLVNIGLCEAILRNESYQTFSMLEDSLVKIQSAIVSLSTLKEAKFRYEHLVPKYLKEAARIKQELTDIHTKLATGTKSKTNYMEEIQTQRDKISKQQQEEEERHEREKLQQIAEVEQQRKLLAEKVRGMKVTSKVEIESEEEGEESSGAEGSRKRRSQSASRSPRKKKAGAAASLSEDFVFSSDDAETDTPAADSETSTADVKVDTLTADIETGTLTSHVEEAKEPTV